MSPTIYRNKGFRYYFFSREETRCHIHIHSQEGEAKFWLEPDICLAKNYCLTKRQLNSIEKFIKEHHNEIREEWNKHFKAGNN